MLGISGLARAGSFGQPLVIEAVGLTAVAVALILTGALRHRPLVLAAMGCAVIGLGARATGAPVAGDVVIAIGAVAGAVCVARQAAGSLAAQIAAVAGGVGAGAVLALATIVAVGVGGDLRAATAHNLGTRLDFETALVDRVVAESLAAAGSSARERLLADQPERLLGAASQPFADPTISAALRTAVAGTTAKVVLLTPDGRVAGQGGFQGVVPQPLIAAANEFRLGVSDGRSGVRVVGDRVYALGALPIQVSGRPVGVVIATDDLSDYVARRPREGVVLDLVPSIPSAHAPQGEDAVVRLVRSRDRSATVTRGDTLVAGRPLGDPGGVPVAVLVARASATGQRSLLRWLLVVTGAAALGVAGACLWLGSAIGGRVGRLTAAARQLDGGDLSARAGLRGEDEVGQLGEAFDDMADALERTHGELSTALRGESNLRGRLASVVGGIQEAVIAVDGAGHITDFNRSAEVLIGRDSADAIGRPVADVVCLGSPGAVGAILERAAHGTDRRRATLEGNDVPVEISTASLGDLGHSTGMVMLVRDLRPELEAERAKNEIIQRVSHELRTPLTPIKGWSGMLGRRDLRSDEAARIGHELLTSSARLERTVEQLIFMAKSSGLGAELQRQDLTPQDLVAESVRLWDTWAPPGRTLTVDIASGLPSLRVDRRWVDQALRELLDNAVKFSPSEGTICLEARAGPGECEVTLAVRDQGRVRPADLERLIAPFEQGDGSTTRKYEGLGLGLAIVERVAAAHDGRLQATVGEQGLAVGLVLPTSTSGSTTNRSSANGVA
ncbi:MAG: hypothetical protein NVS3B12_09510 [Acidimicrobiales bacterium]